MIQLQIGSFIFSVTEQTGFSNEADRMDFGITTLPRSGREPIVHIGEQKADEKTIKLTIKHESAKQLQALVIQSREKKSLSMFDASGRYLGNWYVSLIDTVKGKILANGEAITQQVTIKLVRDGKN